MSCVWGCVGVSLAPATHTYTADTLRGWWREQWGDVRRKERPPSPRAERAAMAAVVRLEADSVSHEFSPRAQLRLMRAREAGDVGAHAVQYRRGVLPDVSGQAVALTSREAQN